jgi:hypothetical protein
MNVLFIKVKDKRCIRKTRLWNDDIGIYGCLAATTNINSISKGYLFNGTSIDEYNVGAFTVPFSVGAMSD